MATGRLVGPTKGTQHDQYRYSETPVTDHEVDRETGTEAASVRFHAIGSIGATIHHSEEDSTSDVETLITII